MQSNTAAGVLPPGVAKPISEIGTSPQMVDIIAKMESFEPRRYRPPGECGTTTDTIGYGHLMTETEHNTGIIEIGGVPVNVNNGISHDQAKTLLGDDITRHKDRFLGLYVPVDTEITQAQFDGLISFVFNTGGLGWITRGPLYGHVAAGRWDEVATYVRTRGTTSGGNRLRGLVGRRAFEADIIAFGRTTGTYHVDGRPTQFTGFTYDESRNGAGPVLGTPINTAPPTPNAPHLDDDDDANDFSVYVIRSGDSLARIATAFSTTVANLLALNPQIDNPDIIHVGEQLNVPAVQEAERQLHRDAVAATANDVPWFEIARREYETGVEESPGRDHDPRILQYHATTMLRATSDEVAWCSAFVNWCMIQAGYKGTNKANARSWVKWQHGVALDTPKRGCIVVFWRGSRDSWKGHVGFLDRIEGESIYVLGGNQANAVNIKAYPKSRLLGYRWPK